MHTLHTHTQHTTHTHTTHNTHTHNSHTHNTHTTHTHTHIHTHNTQHTTHTHTHTHTHTAGHFYHLLSNVINMPQPCANTLFCGVYTCKQVMGGAYPVHTHTLTNCNALFVSLCQCFVPALPILIEYVMLPWWGGGGGGGEGEVH